MLIYYSWFPYPRSTVLPRMMIKRFCWMYICIWRRKIEIQAVSNKMIWYYNYHYTWLEKNCWVSGKMYLFITQIFSWRPNMWASILPTFSIGTNNLSSFFVFSLKMVMNIFSFSKTWGRTWRFQRQTEKLYTNSEH